jgi:hypothetical protein
MIARTVTAALGRVQQCRDLTIEGVFRALVSLRGVVYGAWSATLYISPVGRPRRHGQKSPPIQRSR